MTMGSGLWQICHKYSYSTTFGHIANDCLGCIIPFCSLRDKIGLRRVCTTFRDKVGDWCTNITLNQLPTIREHWRENRFRRHIQFCCLP